MNKLRLILGKIRRPRQVARAILLSGLVLQTACVSKPGPRVNSSEPVAAAPTASVAALLPVTTPFDGDFDAQAIYLQNYRDGYRQGFPGFAAPPWARVGEAYDPAEPRMRGWMDGALAARLAAARKLSKED